MSFISKALGFDGKREKKQAAANQRDWGVTGGVNELWRNQVRAYQDPTQGMDQLTRLIQSQMSRALPQFQGQLQGVREHAISRGLSTGDLGTSYEGDLASAFQQNLADSIAGQTFQLYGQNRNTYLDMLTGQMDRDTENRNAGKNRGAGLLGAAIGAIPGVGDMFNLFGGGK